MSTAQTLYNTLFETLQGLKDGTVSIEKAKAISEVSQTIVNTAKVEVDYLKNSNARNKTAFFEGDVTLIEKQESEQEEKEPIKVVRTQTGIVTRDGNVTTHKMA